MADLSGAGAHMWLQRFLEQSVRMKWCAKINCTTCGAIEFRRGLISQAGEALGRPEFQSWNNELCIETLRALANVEPPPRNRRPYEDAVRLILYEAWSAMDSGNFASESEILANTWAGEVLKKMQEHYQARVLRNSGPDHTP
jgi:hypothetical protein